MGVRFGIDAGRSGRLGDVVQHQQIMPRAGRHGVGMTLIIAELNEQPLVVKLLDNGADPPPRKPMRGNCE